MTAWGEDRDSREARCRSRGAIVFAAGAVLANLLAHGCASVPYDRGVPFQDEALVARLVRAAAEMYPPSLRVDQVVALEAGGRRMDHFRACALARRPDDVRLVAISDFGNTIFDVVRTAGGTRIVKDCPEVPRRWLTEAAARDIAVAYLARPSPQARLVRHDDGTVGLVEDLRGGRCREFIFDPAAGRLTGYIEARGNRLVYRAAFSGYRMAASWPRQVPGAIDVTDFRLDYRLTVQVLDVGARPLDDKVFSERP